MNVEFCLCLPQHAWDSASDDFSLLVSQVNSSDTGKIQAYSCNGPITPKRKKLTYAEAKDLLRNDTEDPGGVKVETYPAVVVSAENDTGTVFVPPGMKKLFKKNVVTFTGYYGKLNFFNAQSDFDQIFGTQPRIYHDFENDKDARNANHTITQFIDNCLLDIFIVVCRIYYVGTNNYGITFCVQEVCINIALLCQTWRYYKVRKLTETPKDLYQKYLNFSVSFPFNATAWPLQLPPTFISALYEKLRCRINSADYF